MTRLIIECSEHDANVFRDGYDAEPAPPKDWRPYCFNKRCCNKEHLGILSDMEPCKSCPYREVKE